MDELTKREKIGYSTVLFIVLIGIISANQFTNNPEAGIENSSSSTAVNVDGSSPIMHVDSNNPNHIWWSGASEAFCKGVSGSWDDLRGQCTYYYVEAITPANDDVDVQVKLERLSLAREALRSCIITFPQTGVIYPNGKCDTEWEAELAAENAIK